MQGPRATAILVQGEGAMSSGWHASHRFARSVRLRDRPSKRSQHHAPSLSPSPPPPLAFAAARRTREVVEQYLQVACVALSETERGARHVGQARATTAPPADASTEAGR